MGPDPIMSMVCKSSRLGIFYKYRITCIKNLLKLTHANLLSTKKEHFRLIGFFITPSQMQKKRRLKARDGNAKDTPPGHGRKAFLPTPGTPPSEASQGTAASSNRLPSRRRSPPHKKRFRHESPPLLPITQKKRAGESPARTAPQNAERSEKQRAGRNHNADAQRRKRER